MSKWIKVDDRLPNKTGGNRMKIEEAIELVRIHHDRPVRADALRKAEVELFNASKKQIPKKPIRFDLYLDGKLEDFILFCPCCNSSYEGQHSYCAICGQKIDWSEEVTE